ncbi:hypothetical protein DC498_15610 [Terrimonas sp.]|nr:MAG: hypothetical protein BGP13_00435 [Sphingobacteriales bacterium 40-81]PVD51303.1 hypothetical protein DC498_15610 [Terrimonas sp.]
MQIVIIYQSACSCEKSMQSRAGTTNNCVVIGSVIIRHERKKLFGKCNTFWLLGLNLVPQCDHWAFF